ncbi:cytochrome c oxidase subunit 3 [Litorivivens sp.]|uniref:cytochrome c oxidase subunit 3 n=1 Tax=Litorivivens sp. TaxID=2020868 RepID=UPI0035688977
MASQGNTAHEVYYVPESSKLAVCATIGLVLTIFGAASGINDGTFGDPNESTNSWFIFWVGLAFFAATLFVWFSTAIKENIAGKNSAQLKRSYAIGMQWFIFSEVMFFFAFFLALFYIRWFAAPWLGGEGEAGRSNYLLWGDFTYSWPLMQTPQDAIGGVANQVMANNGEFSGPERSMAFPGFGEIFKWLPFYNTVILLTSSVTVHWAHHALLHDNRKKFHQWLTVTVLLGVVFVGLQLLEYYEAYAHYGLTLETGVYGTTFFMLTGFHGFHVAMGMIMLLIQLLRSVIGGHFTKDDHFGFAASSWYWHFVDVVWIFLMLVVYIF